MQLWVWGFSLAQAVLRQSCSHGNGDAPCVTLKIARLDNMDISDQNILFYLLKIDLTIYWSRYIELDYNLWLRICEKWISREFYSDVDITGHNAHWFTVLLYILDCAITTRMRRMHGLTVHSI